MRTRDPTKLKALEVKYRGLAIEDGLWDAAEALATQIGANKKPQRVRRSSSQYPFERALTQHFRRMEARFGALFEAAPEAMVVTTATGEIILANERAAAQFGYELDELLGQDLTAMLDGTVAQQLVAEGAEAAFEAMTEQATAGVEVIGIRKDKSRFPVEAMLSEVEAEDGLLVSIAMRDLSPRKAAERKLAIGEAHAQALLGVMPEAMLVVNRRGRIVSANTAAEALFGYAAETLAGQAAETVLPAELSEHFTADIDPELIGTPTARAEHDGRRKDGSSVRIEVALVPVQDELGIVTLVALRDLTEDGLVAGTGGRRFLRQLIEEAPEAIAAVREDGEIVLANAELERRFGYAPGELNGLGVARILPEGFAERLADNGLAPTEVALAQEIGTGIELMGRRKDGSRFPLEILLGRMSLPDGALTIAAMRDISVRKAAERHLAASWDDKLAALKTPARTPKGTGQVQRGRDLEQFAYLVAHDLQEPLRMVASYLQLLAKRYEGRLDADADDFIGFAVDGAGRMQSLITDLLAYCRADGSSLRLEHVSSGDALDEALLNLKVAATEAGAAVSHDDMPELMADRTLLIQLFQNIIGNAIKFRGTEPPQIRVSAQRGKGHWDFMIADNGIGIDPAHAGRLFDMFDRLGHSEAIAGTGIGLALCKRIVERHGGRIWVEAGAAGGSVFHFTLPEADAK